MFSKAEPTFHAVACSDAEDRVQQPEQKHHYYTPAATKPPLLVVILCLVISFIAFLQVVAFRSEDVRNGTNATNATNATTTTRSTNTTNALSKRQDYTSTEIYGGLTQTITGNTITYDVTTATFPSTTLVIPATTQTITGTTETIQGRTDVVYGVVSTNSGSVFTLRYELTTIDGTVSTILQAGTTAPSAYLNIATSSSTTSEIATLSSASATQDATSSITSNAYLSISSPSSSAAPTQATPPSAYLTFPSPSSSTDNVIATPSPQSGINNQSTLLQVDVNRIVTGQFTTSRYYVATYLCSIIVVLLKCVWVLVFASTKLVDPFHQLKQAGGANIKVSLMAEHLSSGISINSPSSLLTKRPLMLLATIVSLITTVLAPIAAESMSVKVIRMNNPRDGNTTTRIPVWILNMPCIRIVQAFLALAFCLIFSYIVLSLRGFSGVFSNPSSIASVASLLGNREFVDELRQIPVNASKKDIQKMFEGNKYGLANFESSPGHHSYGIVKTNHVRNVEAVINNRVDSSQNTRPSMKGKYMQDILLLVLSTGLFALVLAYDLDGNNDALNNFFNSQTFGPRFVLSALATMLDNRWKRLEREVRMLQPYRQLHKKSNTSTNILITNKAFTSLTSFPMALWRGDFFLATVALVTILGDALIIAVVGVPYSEAEIHDSYQVSAYLSLSISGLMIVTSIAAMIWRRGNPPMPREPDTLLSIATYLCASEVTEQLVPFSTTSEVDRDRVVKTWNQNYWFGMGLGRDRKVRWLVDKDDGGSQ